MTGLYAKYFVLKPRGDDDYAVASRRAMFSYASWIRQTNPELAREIWDWTAHAQINSSFPDEPLPPPHWKPEGGIDLKWVTE